MANFTLIITILLFLIGISVAYFLGLKFGAFRRDKHWEDRIPEHRKDAVMRSRAVLSGNFSEQLAPYLPDFKYSPTECRFLGKPIDFIVFKGMDEKDINEVIFVEVKSGKSKLSSSEKKLKDAIDNKRVRWVEYRVPEDLTKKDEEVI